MRTSSYKISKSWQVTRSEVAAATDTGWWCTGGAKGVDLKSSHPQRKTCSCVRWCMLTRPTTAIPSQLYEYLVTALYAWN